MGLAERWAQGQRRGQSAAEYAIVFSVVIAALVGMQIYVKRGLNARMKDGSDGASSLVAAKLGVSGNAANDAKQYEPYYTKSNYDVAQTSDRNDTIATGGVLTRNIAKEQTTRTGNQTVGGVNDAP